MLGLRVECRILKDVRRVRLHDLRHGAASLMLVPKAVDPAVRDQW